MRGYGCNKNSNPPHPQAKYLNLTSVLKTPSYLFQVVIEMKFIINDMGGSGYIAPLHRKGGSGKKQIKRKPTHYRHTENHH